MTDPRILRAQSADAATVVDIVTSAFFDLAVSRWLVPAPHQRQRPLQAHLALAVEHALQHGHVDVTDDHAAAAVWIHHDEPDQPPPPPHDYADRLDKACHPHTDRFDILDALFHHTHPHDRAHHHLALLAVHPDRQRHGHGTALLRHHHRHLDQHRLGGFLVAADTTSARLYERLGYARRGEATLADGGPTMYPMWRAPRAPHRPAATPSGRRTPRRTPRSPATGHADNAPSWVPQEIDTSRPSAARVYDHLLGGCHNFPADRELAHRLQTVQPNVEEIARNNRAFLRRAVRFMLEAGIRQFLDLGSGIPTVGNVHEIAQAAAPQARVVYVDHDPVAVAHSRLLLADNPNAAVVAADITRPDDVLDTPATRRLLDFDRPIGLLAITVGHYIAPTADPAGVLARYRDALAPGSHLALTHLTDDFSAVRGKQIVDTMKSTNDHVFPRTRAEVLQLFTGFDLVDPGLVTTSRWRPEPGLQPAAEAQRDGLYAGVGRRR